MRRGRRAGICITAAVLAVCLCACAGGRKETAVLLKEGEGDRKLVIYCPHPLEFINPIVSEFEAQTEIDVEVQTGGTGELLQMVEQQAGPACDIFWGGSLSTTMQGKELFEPYISLNEEMIQEEFHNEEGNMTRFTDIPSVLMVNENLIGDIRIEGYEDLLNPELKGKIAMCSPSNSSSAYEHLINMLYAMGNGDPEAGWPYVEAFIGNLDGNLVKGSSAVYQGVAEGRFAVGLTFEEGAAHYAVDGSPVKLVYMKEGVISKPDVVCIVKGTGHGAEARAFVDFVTGKDAQTVIASKLDRRSVRKDVEEPGYLPDKASLHMIYDDPQVVNRHKEEWLQRFASCYQNSLKQIPGSEVPEP